MTAQSLAHAPDPTTHAPTPRDVPRPADVTIPPELQARDWIFRDPASYRAGVREALAWVAASPDHAQVITMPSAPRSAQPTPPSAAGRPARTGS